MGGEEDGGWRGRRERFVRDAEREERGKETKASSGVNNTEQCAMSVCGEGRVCVSDRDWGCNVVCPFSAVCKVSEVLPILPNIIYPPLI
jgi:hypothetical protein